MPGKGGSTKDGRKASGLEVQNLVWKYSQQYLLIGSGGGADGVRKKEKSTVSLNSKFWAQTARSAS